MAYSSDESIYDIIPAESSPLQRPPRYRSGHNSVVPPTGSTFGITGTSCPDIKNIAGSQVDPIGSNHHYRKASATFGHAPGTNKPDPDKILKKNTNVHPVKSLNEVRSSQPDLLEPSTPKEKVKPSVPGYSEKPLMNLKTDKCFITANAVDAILSVPPKREPVGKCTITDKEFLSKEDYGRVPEYLRNIKQQLSAEFEYIRRYRQQYNQKHSGSGYRALSEEERVELLEGLAKKWEVLNKEYLSRTHITKVDSIGQAKRREQLETTLGQIEKDLENLKRKHIYVFDC